MVLSATAAVALVSAFLAISWLIPALVSARPCRNPPPRPAAAAGVALLSPNHSDGGRDEVAVTPMRFWALFIYWCAHSPAGFPPSLPPSLLTGPER
jgi:hypothetical protein